MRVLEGEGTDRRGSSSQGHDGRYNNPNFKPVYYHELIDPTEKGTDCASLALFSSRSIVSISMGEGAEADRSGLRRMPPPLYFNPTHSPQEVLEQRLSRMDTCTAFRAESDPLRRCRHGVDEARSSGHHAERQFPSPPCHRSVLVLTRQLSTFDDSRSMVSTKRLSLTQKKTH